MASFFCKKISKAVTYGFLSFKFGAKEPLGVPHPDTGCIYASVALEEGGEAGPSGDGA